MRTGAFIQRCIAAGMPLDMALEAAKAFDVECAEAVEEALEKVKKKARDRQARHRERALSRDKRDEDDVTEVTSRHVMSRDKRDSLAGVVTNPLRIITTEDTQEDKSSFVSDVKPKADKRGTRLDPGWSMTADDLAYALTRNLTPQEAARAADDYRDYWCAHAGPNGVKRDWPATWRRWARTAGDRKREAMARRPQSGGYRPIVEDMASVVARRHRERDDGVEIPGIGKLLLGSGFG